MLKLVLVVALFATLVYMLMLALERRRASGPSRSEQPVSRAVAPDDDEDFLRSLNRRRGNDTEQ